MELESDIVGESLIKEPAKYNRNNSSYNIELLDVVGAITSIVLVLKQVELCFHVLLKVAKRQS